MRRLVVLLAATILLPSTALAHGRPAFMGDIAFHPENPDVVVVRATFGLVISEDRGVTWRWICAAVTGADPTRENPPILVTPDGAVLVGTFSGLARSTPERCEFERPAALDNRFVIDLNASPTAPGTVWAVATSGGSPDEIYRSIDQGRTFEQVGASIEDLLVERVRVAPSDASRVYLSGAVPTMVQRVPDGGLPDGGIPDGGLPMLPRRGYFLRSSDGGETYTSIEMPLEDAERNVHLLAVDPTDADRVLVRMTRQLIDVGDERVVLTEDGGDTWTTVALARQVSGGAFSSDGTRAWISSTDVDGLFRSDDGGRTFAQLQRMNLPCLELLDDEPWVCVNQFTDGFALGRVSDSMTIEETLRFDQIYDLVECSSCTTVGHVCPMWFPDVAFDLRLDAGGAFDGGVSGSPRDAGATPSCTDMDAGGGSDGGPDEPGGGCGCHVTRPAGGAPWLIATVLALTLRRRFG